MSSEAVLDTPVTETPSKAGLRRISWPLVIATVAALAGVSWGWSRYRFALTHVTTDNAQVDGHITPISSKVQAFVASVRVEENQTVAAGDTLVVLDDRDLRLRLAEAEADLARASDRRRGQAPAELAWSRAQAQSAEATVAEAEARLRKATSDLERVRGLAERHIVPAQQLDGAQAEYDAAKAAAAAAERQQLGAANQVEVYSTGVATAEAGLAAARAAVASARLQLSYAVITAPSGGTVARRAVEPGALVQVGQTLMSIIPDHAVWVTANLKETELTDVSVGDHVTFSVDAYPGVRFAGRVESLSPATGARFALLPPDNATGNFTKVVQRVPVRITVENTDPAHPLRPGMSVEVVITTR